MTVVTAMFYDVLLSWVESAIGVEEALQEGLQISLGASMKQVLSNTYVIRTVSLIYGCFAAVKLMPLLTFAYFQLAYHGEADVLAVLSAFTDAWQMPRITLSILIASFLVGLAGLSGAIAVFFCNPLAVPLFLITLLLTAVQGALPMVSHFDWFRGDLGLAIVLNLATLLPPLALWLYARYLRSIGILRKWKNEAMADHERREVRA